MDYYTLADELINMRSSRPHISFDRKLSKAMKGEIFVLNYLNNHGKTAHPKDLSGEMAVSTARTAVILNHLEHDGLIVRMPDSGDNRQIIVTLSEKGVALLEEKHRELLRYMAKILEKLGEKDASEYIRIQKKLMTVLADD